MCCKLIKCQITWGLWIDHWICKCVGHSWFGWLRAYCCCSVAQSCLTLYDPMDCSTPGFPVLPCLPEFAQTSVHWVGDAIQPSHPLLPPSPLALNLSQHPASFLMNQDLFSYDFRSVEDIRVKQGVPGIIPLQTGHINGKHFSRAHLCCVRFSVEEM